MGPRTACTSSLASQPETTEDIATYFVRHRVDVFVANCFAVDDDHHRTGDHERAAHHQRGHDNLATDRRHLRCRRRRLVRTGHRSALGVVHLDVTPRRCLFHAPDMDARKW